MQLGFVPIFASTAGLVVGTFIGLVFGAVQDAAARKHQRLQVAGQFKTGWSVVPGSMRRTAYFLMILAAVQLICPLLFTNGCQWWVSGGVMLGYGWTLFRQLQQRYPRAK